jgi:hypothetical protein
MCTLSVRAYRYNTIYCRGLEMQALGLEIQLRGKAFV